MENTTENKEKFFATYWGSETDFFSAELDGEFVKIGPYFFSGISRFHRNKSKASLKPLSAITDEDAIEAIKICGVYVRKDGAYVTEHAPINNIKKSFQDVPVWRLDVADFLRSRSYALPFHDLSVEDLIAYGWVKLTKHTL